jgi:hypothetical protein
MTSSTKGPSWRHFEGRDVPSYAVTVPEAELHVGQVYFTVHFCDTVSLVAELEALAFVGKDIYPDDEGQGYYFQDACSFLSGVPYETTGEDEPVRVFMRSGQVHAMDYERALDVLLHCGLLRRDKGL